MILYISDILNYISQQNIDCHYYVDKNLSINNFCSLNNLKANSITWIKNIEKYDLTNIDKTLKLLIVTNNKSIDEIKIKGYNVITCSNPKEIFFSILTEFFKNNTPSKI